MKGQLPEKTPISKRRELEHIQDIIIKGLDTKKSMFHLEMIILFGSYARGEWVEERCVKNGVVDEYQSDLDILIVTREEMREQEWVDLQIMDYIDKDPDIKTEVNIIHHDIDFLNRRIEKNYYFFTDIAKEGIILYDSGLYKLATPGPIDAETMVAKAQEELAYWVERGDFSVENFRFCLDKKEYKEAAFNLHQAAERYYSAILLVYTDYRPRGHNILWFNKQVIGMNSGFREAFPMNNREERKRFHLLKRAYIESRYKKNYTITVEELTYLAERVQVLRRLTQTLCEREIARLKSIIPA